MSSLQKSKSASTKLRAVLVLTACILVLAASLRYQKYQNIVEQAERLTLESLQNVVWGLAQSIDGSEHQLLQEKYGQKDQIRSNDQDPLYHSLHLKLAKAQQHLGYETPIYTYTTTGNGQEVVFIGTSAKAPYFRHEWSSAPQAQLDTYGNYLALPKYSDSHGTWLSACAPIFNDKGEVVAMVQADRCFDRFIEQAEQKAFAGLWWNVVLIFGLVFFIWNYMSNLIDKEEKAKQALLKIVEEKTQLTERLALREKELEQQKSLLLDKNQYLEDFANIASHDLKSPLRGISNFAGLLERRLGPSTESSATEYVAYIKSNAKRALKLVDGILSYSKLGKNAQKNVSCNLLEVAHDALSNLNAVVAERNAQVKISHDLPTAICDPVIVTQLFQNLIGNGLKYNESETPTITVDTQIDEQLRQVISVTDNGIGIADEYKESVFEMFRRLHSGDEQYEGSGIGLAFCMRIIDSYGGEMWLESEEGEGSTFFFTLPLAFAEAQNCQVEASTSFVTNS